MQRITDEYMREMLKTTQPYTIVILHRTPMREEPGADEIVWEHGRRNFELRRDGVLCIVGQVERDDSDVAGICVFSTDAERTREVMDGDPAVKAGIFVYKTHLNQSFPGDALTFTSLPRSF
jgi:hypothetical protein